MRYKNKPTSNKDCMKGAYSRCPDRHPKTAVILTTQKDLECRCMKKYKQNKNKVVRPLKKKKSEQTRAARVIQSSYQVGEPAKGKTDMKMNKSENRKKSKQTKKENVETKPPEGLCINYSCLTVPAIPHVSPEVPWGRTGLCWLLASGVSVHQGRKVWWKGLIMAGPWERSCSQSGHMWWWPGKKAEHTQARTRNVHHL